MFDRTSLYLRFDIDRTSLWHRLESKDVTKGKREQCEKLTNEHWGLAVVHRTPVRERSLSPVHIVPCSFNAEGELVLAAVHDNVSP